MCMTNFDKAFEKVWSHVPYYDVVYKNYYNDEMINRVLKLKAINSFLKFLEDEKNKLNKEFESLYSKEVLKEVVKIWFEKDNFLNKDLKNLTAGINMILLCAVKRRRISIEDYIKNEQWVREKALIPLKVSYTGDSSTLDIYNALRVDSTIGSSRLFHYNINEICRERPENYFLPLSFLYVDWVYRNVEDKAEETLDKLEEIGYIDNPGNPGFKEKFEESKRVKKKYSEEFLNIFEICKGLKEEYLKSLKGENKEFMLLGKMIDTDVLALSLDLSNENKYEDLVDSLIMNLKFLAMGLRGVDYTVN